MNFRLIFLIVLTLSCSTINTSQKRSLASIDSYDRIIAFGATTQGNGYNWAATVSWLGTKLADTVEQARLAENRGEEVAIKIVNFSGGSSGSGVTMLFDAFLSNGNIISSSPQALQERLLTIEDAHRLSRALIFAAMSFDFTWFFSASTFANNIKQNTLSILGMISDKLPLTGKSVKTLWRARMSGKVVVADFAKYVNFAKEVNWENINEEIIWGTKEFKKLSPSFAKSEEAKLIIKSLTHFYSLPLIDKPVQLPDTDLILLREITQAQSKAARRVLNNMTKAHFKKYDKKSNLYRVYSAKPNSKRIKQKNPLKQTMSQSMGDGMITITMAQGFKTKKEMKSVINKHGLVYKDLRPYLFMNESTAKKIINSHEYQSAILKGDTTLKRYIIAVIDQRWAGVNPSVREPGLLNQLYGKIAGTKFRIKKIFDPAAYNSEKFQLVDIENYNEKYLFVAGGFPFQEMIAIPSAFYFVQEVEKLQQRHPKVRPTYYLFGHPKNKTAAQETFAGRALYGVFNKSGTEQEFQESFKDWGTWSRSWTNKILNRLFPKYNILTIETLFNWSTGALPAALTGQSRVLVQNAAVVSSKTNIVQKLHGVYSLYPPKDPNLAIEVKPK